MRAIASNQAQQAYPEDLVGVYRKLIEDEIEEFRARLDTLIARLVEAKGSQPGSKSDPPSGPHTGIRPSPLAIDPSSPFTNNAMYPSTPAPATARVRGRRVVPDAIRVRRLRRSPEEIEAQVVQVVKLVKGNKFGISAADIARQTGIERDFVGVPLANAVQRKLIALKGTRGGARYFPV